MTIPICTRGHVMSPYLACLGGYCCVRCGLFRSGYPPGWRDVPPPHPPDIGADIPGGGAV